MLFAQSFLSVQIALTHPMNRLQAKIFYPL